jgi:hypothetical protein
MYRNMLPGSFILTPNYNFHVRMGLNQYEAAMWQRVKNNQSFTELKQGTGNGRGKDWCNQPSGLGGTIP